MPAEQSVALQLFENWLPVALSFIGAVVWLIRLEGRLNLTQAESARRTSQIEEDVSRRTEQIDVESMRRFDQLEAATANRYLTLEAHNVERFRIVEQRNMEVRDDVKYIRERIDAMVAHVVAVNRTTFKDG